MHKKKILNFILATSLGISFGISLQNFTSPTFTFLQAYAAEESVDSIIEDKYIRVYDLGMAQYLGIVLKDGVDYNKCEFYVDGNKIHPSKVTTNGKILKWEINSLNNKTLTIKYNNKNYNVVFNNKATGDSNFNDENRSYPSYIWSYGAMSIFDYHTPAIDTNGEEILKSEKSTYDLHDINKRAPIRSFAKEGHAYEDGIDIKFELRDNVDKEWFNGVTEVSRIYNTLPKKGLDEKLKFTKEITKFNDYEIGVIHVEKHQRPLSNEGIVSFRVIGKDGKVEIVKSEIIKDLKLELLKTGSIIDNRILEDVKFQFKNLTIGTLSPITQVTLIKPDGSEKILKNLEEYYHINPLFTVRGKNNKENILDQPGVYTLKIKALGYDEVIKKFKVNPLEGSDEATNSHLKNVPNLSKIQKVYDNTNTSFRLGFEKNSDYINNIEEIIIDNNKIDNNNIQRNITPGTIVIKKYGKIYEDKIIKIKSKGYKDLYGKLNVSNKTFSPIHTTSSNKLTSLKVDAITRATARIRPIAGKSSIPSSGTNFGGVAINTTADILFNYDMLVNAKLLNKMNLGDSGTKAVSNFFDTGVTNHKALISEDGIKYEYIDFQNKYNDDNINNKYLSFDKYRKENPSIIQDSAYSYKYVLLDGRLGIPSFHTQFGKQAPEFEEVTIKINEPLIIELPDDYAKNITEIRTKTNWQATPKDNYEIFKKDGKSYLGIKFDAFGPRWGEYNNNKGNVIIRSKGYLDTSFKVNLDKTKIDRTENSNIYGRNSYPIDNTLIYDGFVNAYYIKFKDLSKNKEYISGITNVKINKRALEQKDSLYDEIIKSSYILKSDSYEIALSKIYDEDFDASKAVITLTNPKLGELKLEINNSKKTVTPISFIPLNDKSNANENEKTEMTGELIKEETSENNLPKINISVSKIEKNYFDNKFTIVFTPFNDANNYLDTVTSVKIGDRELKKGSSFSNDNEYYQLLNNDASLGLKLDDKSYVDNEAIINIISAKYSPIRVKINKIDNTATILTNDEKTEEKNNDNLISTNEEGSNNPSHTDSSEEDKKNEKTKETIEEPKTSTIEASNNNDNKIINSNKDNNIVSTNSDSSSGNYSNLTYSPIIEPLPLEDNTSKSTNINNPYISINDDKVVRSSGNIKKAKEKTVYTLLDKLSELYKKHYKTKKINANDVINFAIKNKLISKKELKYKNKKLSTKLSKKIDLRYIKAFTSKKIKK